MPRNLYQTGYYNPTGVSRTLDIEVEFGSWLQSREVPVPIKNAFQGLLGGYFERRAMTDFLKFEKNGEQANHTFSMPIGGKDALVYYTAYGKPVYTDPYSGDLVEDSTRQGMKIGRWLKAVFTDKFLKYYDITDATIEALSKAASNRCNPKQDIRLVRGQDIVRNYREANHAAETGTLSGSCMKHGTIKDERFRLYYDNPNCSMLVVFDGNDKVRGRALVWTPVHIVAKDAQGREQFAGDVTFMDRIFSVNTTVDVAMIKYATEQGWYHKTHQTAHSQKAVTTPTGERWAAYMTVDIPFEKIGRFPGGYPYCDTFLFMAETFDRVQNYSTPTCMYEMREGGQLANFQDRQGQRRTAIHGWVHIENIAVCPHCNRDGERQSFFKVYDTQEYVCVECAPKHYVYCRTQGIYYKPQDAVLALDSYGGYDYVSKPEAVYSKLYDSLIIERLASRLAYPEDYVISTITNVTYSSYHAGNIVTQDAEYVNFCMPDGQGSWVHKDMIDKAKEASVLAREVIIREKSGFIERARAKRWPQTVREGGRFQLGDLAMVVRNGDVPKPVVITGVLYDTYRYGSGWAYQIDEGRDYIDAGWFTEILQNDEELSALKEALEHAVA